MSIRTLSRFVAALAAASIAPPAVAQSFEPIRPTIVVDTFVFGAPSERREPRDGYIAPPRYGRPPIFHGAHSTGDVFRPASLHGSPRRRAHTTASYPPPSEGAAAGASTTSDDFAALGAGVADLVVERLVRSGRFRILERQRLAAVQREQRMERASGEATPSERARMAGARYYLTGTITRFGTEDRSFLGGGGSRGGIGILGIRRRRTEVVLVARIIDTRTGEIVASVRGEGESSKGSGLTLGGLGGGAGGIGNVSSAEFRSSALGQALDAAVEALAAELVQASAMLRP